MGQIISMEEIGSIRTIDKNNHLYEIHLKNGKVLVETIMNDFLVGRMKLAIGQKSDLNWSKEQQERAIEENKKGGSFDCGLRTYVFPNSNNNNLHKNSDTQEIYIKDIFFISNIGRSSYEELQNLFNDYLNKKISYDTFKTSWKKIINKFLNETRRDLNLYEKSKL